MNTISRNVPSKDLRDSLADVLGGVAYGSVTSYRVEFTTAAAKEIRTLGAQI